MSRLTSPSPGSRRCAQARVAVARPEANLEIALAILVILALFAAAWLSDDRSAEATWTPETSRVQVSEGDTLWSLARAHPIPEMTTAQTVTVLARLNDVEDGALTVGSVLLVPAVAEHGEQVAFR